MLFPLLMSDLSSIYWRKQIDFIRHFTRMLMFRGKAPKNNRFYVLIKNAFSLTRAD